MAIVDKNDIKNSLVACGLASGDTVLVHSSLKACGHVNGGADTVIDAFLEVLGPGGTLVMPTLSQKDFTNAYRDWSLDRPSDVGLITETFRLRRGSVRSDQATHSVAAQGSLAGWLTRDHGRYGRRDGAFGDTPFAVCSPWQKLYDMNAKIMLFGVTMESNTMKHLVEYIMVNELLDKVSDSAERAALESRLCRHENFGKTGFVWPYSSGNKAQEKMEAAGLLRHATCGEAVLTCYRAGETNDYSRRLFESNPAAWYGPDMVKWFDDALKAVAASKRLPSHRAFSQWLRVV